jgi:prepilin-type N-terminal cleavage/methylation domain-containing protein
MSSALRDQRGFTLAELLVVTAIIGMVMAGIFTLQLQGQQVYLYGSNRVETQQNTRVALDLMTRDLRSAQSITAIPSGQDMTFVDENGNSIRYNLSGTTLNRTDPVNGMIPLMGGVQSLTFTYYSAYDGSTNTGTTTATASLVTSVKVRVQTKSEDQTLNNYGNELTTMESMIRLRNMGV